MERGNGKATASDVLFLISRIQEEVSTRFGIQLIPEVMIAGELE